MTRRCVGCTRKRYANRDAARTVSHRMTELNPDFTFVPTWCYACKAYHITRGPKMEPMS